MSRILSNDEQLRTLHQQAVQSLSPSTLARLRAGRHAAGATPRRRPAWWLASAFAGVAALGIGVHLQMRAPPAPAIAPMVAALEDTGSTFDESPDLYLWLGGTDLAME